ncbi:MAG: hypothetical protein ACREGK_14830 [Geminicoccales bacterium]
MGSAVSVWLLAAPTGQAAESPRQQLARTHSPIVMLRAREEDPPCDPSEEQSLHIGLALSSGTARLYSASRSTVVAAFSRLVHGGESSIADAACGTRVPISVPLA